MSYKFGMLLSTIFVVLFFLLGMDLLSIQYGYSNLDAKSVSISYRISEHGTLDDKFIESLENYYQVDFTCTSSCNPSFGDIVEYTISSTIQTIVISPKGLTIKLARSVVIGFFK